MTTKQVNLSEEQNAFIQEIIASGQYQDVDAVIEASVRLLEERLANEERQKAKLRTMLEEAIAGGVSDRTPEQIWEDVKARHQRNRE